MPPTLREIFFPPRSDFKQWTDTDLSNAFLDVIVRTFKNDRDFGFNPKDMQDFCDAVVWKVKNECPFGNTVEDLYRRIVSESAHELVRRRDIKDSEVAAVQHYGQRCTRGLESAKKRVLYNGEMPQCLDDSLKLSGADSSIYL